VSPFTLSLGIYGLTRFWVVFPTTIQYSFEKTSIPRLKAWDPEKLSRLNDLVNGLAKVKLQSLRTKFLVNFE
jgi:hypothetical protein